MVDVEILFKVKESNDSNEIELLNFSFSCCWIWFRSKSIRNVTEFLRSYSVNHSSWISPLNYFSSRFSFRWTGSNTTPNGDGQGTASTDRSNLLMLKNKVKFTKKVFAKKMNPEIYSGSRSQLEPVWIFKFHWFIKPQLSWQFNSSGFSQFTTCWSSIVSCVWTT